jgi:hypothetical protein
LWRATARRTPRGDCGPAGFFGRIARPGRTLRRRARVRAEREAAIRAAAAIGPNVTRLAEADTEAAQGYRASVAAQLEADQTAIPNLSDRAVAGLRLVAAAKTDQARTEAYSALTADAGLKREVECG